MEIQLTAKEVISLAQTADASLEDVTGRVAQRLKVQTILHTAKAVNTQAKVTLTEDDYCALTRLPTNAM